MGASKAGLPYPSPVVPAQAGTHGPRGWPRHQPEANMLSMGPRLRGDDDVLCGKRSHSPSTSIPYPTNSAQSPN
ncbi:hypothetical protein GCM10027318_22620 [Massilia agilis]